MYTSRQVTKRFGLVVRRPTRSDGRRQSLFNGVYQKSIYGLSKVNLGLIKSQLGANQKSTQQGLAMEPLNKAQASLSELYQADFETVPPPPPLTLHPLCPPSFTFARSHSLVRYSLTFAFRSAGARDNEAVGEHQHRHGGCLHSPRRTHWLGLCPKGHSSPLLSAI